VPGLVDLVLLARICEAAPLPVNAMSFPGAPSAAAFAEAGVARISHGPGPYRIAMQAIEQAARTVFAG
jgi:2-methylisocitrate lyase-like PEP mutase family enzyme